MMHAIYVNMLSVSILGVVHIRLSMAVWTSDVREFEHCWGDLESENGFARELVN